MCGSPEPNHKSDDVDLASGMGESWTVESVVVAMGTAVIVVITW